MQELCAAYINAPQSEKRDILAKLVMHARIHNKLEERVLVPTIRKYVPCGQRVAERTLNDIVRFEKAFQQIEELARTNSDQLEDMVPKVIVVRRHIYIILYSSYQTIRSQFTC